MTDFLALGSMKNMKKYYKSLNGVSSIYFTPPTVYASVISLVAEASSWSVGVWVQSVATSDQRC